MEGLDVFMSHTVLSRCGKNIFLQKFHTVALRDNERKTRNEVCGGVNSGNGLKTQEENGSDREGWAALLCRNVSR